MTSYAVLSDAMLAYFVALTAALGLSVGSFLNVVAYRLPRRLPIAYPPSHCPACAHALSWAEKLPLAGYALVKGRCRGCRASIPLHYPIVEAVTAGAFVGAFLAFGPTIEAVRLALAGAVLVAAAETDRRAGLIPNALVAWGLGLGLLVRAFEPGALPEALFAGAGAAVALLLARWLGTGLFGRPGLGLGDVKLAAALGVLIGGDALWGLYLAAVLAGTVGLAGLAAGRLRRDSRLPFAPFIAAGTLLALAVLPLTRVLAWLP